jgi:hypothetical protein
VVDAAFAKLIERCSDGVEDQAAEEEASWGRERINCPVRAALLEALNVLDNLGQKGRVKTICGLQVPFFLTRGT